MLYSIRNSVDVDTWRWFDELLVKGKVVEKSFGPTSGIKVLRKGQGEGQLFGGNLTLLVNLIGTQTDFDTNGSILFVEDYDEYFYSIDRMFLHLKRSGKLDGLSGLVIGQMSKIEDDPSHDIPFGYTVEDIVLEHCGGTSFPIVSNFPFGHLEKQFTLPLGIKGRLIAKENGEVHFSLLEPAVS